ncbi:MAG: extracellular solute-binding protein, partial [Nitrososphaerota archaeon]|nr:extracellular solute-binding protein [Nitrososphaerota archaeon]
TEANASVTNALVKAYMAKNPNVTIQVVSQPADNYFALLKAAAVAQSGPDIMTMWTGLFALQNQTYLEPITLSLDHNGTNVRLVFELWVFQTNTSSFAFDNRINQLYLNVTGPSV